MNVYLETMGCQMNRLDSELAIGALRAAGHVMTDDRRAADVILYNTCSVRRHAEEKVCSRLGADGQRKEAGKRIIVGVLGCMAQREGKELLRHYPYVDILCGPGRLHELPALIERAAGGKREAGGKGAVISLDPSRKDEIDAGSDERMDAMDLGRDVSLAAAGQAFVRVMRGCDKFCTYCIVPFVRGPQRSRDPGQIVEEVRRLAEAGRQEVTLLGQTVNSYAWKGGETTVRFSDLLERVSAVAGLRRVRFVTSHPSDFGNDILEAMRDLPNVCEYLHCPAQSGSDAVLARMNRKYTRAQYDDLVDRARAIVPEVVLAGDFIVGFPGESDADHEASAELIRRSRYKNCFVFKYSPRPGTAADKRLEDDVPVVIKKRRNNELLAVQEEVGLVHHQAYVGRDLEVLVEGPSPRAQRGNWGQTPISNDEIGVSPQFQLVGRTRWDHIVIFDGPGTLAGQYVPVRIVKADSLTLFGELPHG